MRKPGAYQHILLVEDDRDDQEIFLLALDQVLVDITCTTENNAQQALEKLQARQLSADLIFLDLNMPAMNGYEFLSEIKKHDILRETPVIILSTSSPDSAKNDTRLLGASDFITKPDNYLDLIQILNNLLA